MFNFRKIRKNVKAISPVISVLLMIAVAVVASLVAYAWVMGYIGFQTAKTGQAIQIQSIAFDTDKSIGTVYIQNVGDGAVNLIAAQSLYLNGALDMAATVNDAQLAPGETATITVGSATTFNSGDMVVVKVTSEGGTYSQISQLVP